MGTLANSTPAILLRDYIIAGGRQALFNGWEFKFGKIPASPDQVIVMIDDGGRAAFPHLLVDYPNIQILVRSSRGGDGYLTSHLMAKKIRDIILGLQSRPQEFTELISLTERGTIVPLGYDDSDRHTWSSNYQLITEPETNALTNRVSL